MNAVAAIKQPVQDAADDFAALAATVQEPLELRLSDTCDRCGYSTDERADGSVTYSSISQAFVAARLPGSATVLRFCGHHFVQHADALMERGAEVLDRRETINEKPMSGVADIPGQEAANLG